jgi:RHS repeat-associated protein
VPSAGFYACTKFGVIEQSENRLLQINYPGSATYSQFVYDSFDHVVLISEFVSGSITSTKQFVWAAGDIQEARNSSGGIISQYFACGQTIGTSNCFTFPDHLASIRELTDTSGVTQSVYNYSPNGAVTFRGAVTSDFQYAGYYYHAPSGLNLTENRFFSSKYGRFINRDPIGEDGGINVYCYVDNDRAPRTQEVILVS